MSTITTLLDDLAVERQRLEQVEQQILAAAPASLVDERQRLEQQCKQLEATIKAKAKHIAPVSAHTLVGRLLQLVWTAGRLDVGKLEQLARSLGASDEQVAACTGSGFWSIRKTASK